MDFAELKELKDLNRFRIARRLAQGGMGAVYEAKQLGTEGFEKTVALKIILEEFSQDPEFVEMFIGEAKLVANLVHENIVQIYQLGKLDTMYYMSMEYVNGINLNQFIQRHIELGQPMDMEMCVFIMSRICRALEYAHSKTDEHGNLLGVVHRDVTPSNVMISSGGVVKLTDFGIAKAAHFMRNQEGEVLMGKIRYMSPEQAEYKETDRRSDVFGVGIVLWELLSGLPLFEEEDTDTTLNNVSSKPIPPIREVNPKVPADVEKILEKALKRDLDERYPDAGTMGFDMEYYMYHNRYGPTNVALEKYLAKLFEGTDVLSLYKKKTKPGEKDRVLAAESSTIALLLEDLKKELGQG